MEIKTNSIPFFLLLITLGVSVFLGMVWVLWGLFKFVVVALWVDAPIEIAQMSYWVFLALWILLAVIGNLFKSGK